MNGWRKRQLLFVAVFLVIGTMVFAAGKQEAATEKGIVLQMWKHAWAGSDMVLDELIVEYEEQNAGVKINRVATPDGEHYTKLSIGLASNERIDIFDTADSKFHTYYQNGFTSPIDYRALGHSSIQDLENEWVDNTIGAFKDEKGEIHAMPIEVNPYLMFANAKHYREAGLDIDAFSRSDAYMTWDELGNIAQKLTVRDQDGNIIREGFDWPFNLFGGFYQLAYEPIVMQAGAAIWNESDTEALLDSPACIQAAQIWKDMVYKYKVSAPEVGVTSMGSNMQDFTDGQVSNFFGGPYGIRACREVPEAWENYRVLNFPQINTEKPINGVYMWTFVVNRTSDYKGEAWRFLDFVTDHYSVWLDKITFIVPKKDALNAPAIKALKGADVFLAGMATSRLRQATTHMSEFWDVLKPALQAICLENGDPATVLAKYDEILDNSIAD